MRRQEQPNGPQRRHAVHEAQRERVLQVDLDDVAQVGALGEGAQVLEVEDALDDLVGALGVADDGHVGCAVQAQDGVLGAKVALARKAQLVLHVAQLDEVGQVVHVANDLLEVHGRHGHDGLELGGRDLNVYNVNVEHAQLVRGTHAFVRVVDADAERVGVVGLHVECEEVVVGDGLDEHVQLKDVDAHVQLLLAGVRLELVGVELQVHQDGVGGIEGHDAHTGLVELEVHVHEDLLEGIDHLLDGRGLHGLNLEEKAGGGLLGGLGVHCGVGEGGTI